MIFLETEYRHERDYKDSRDAWGLGGLDVRPRGFA